MLSNAGLDYWKYDVQAWKGVCIIRCTLTQRFKLLGALALLVSLDLPIARGCTPVRNENAEGKPVSPDLTEPLPQDVRVIQNYKYVFESFRPNQPEDWLILSALPGRSLFSESWSDEKISRNFVPVSGSPSRIPV